MFFFDDRAFWNKCVLCGNTVHPWQELSGLPLVDGIVCPSCHYDRVYATVRNNGVPSRMTCTRNLQTGKWETWLIPDDPKKKAKRL